MHHVLPLFESYLYALCAVDMIYFSIHNLLDIKGQQIIVTWYKSFQNCCLGGISKWWNSDLKICNLFLIKTVSGIQREYH